MKKVLKILSLILIVFIFNGCIIFDDPNLEGESILYQDLTMNNACVYTSEVQMLLGLKEGNIGEDFSRNGINKYTLSYKNISNENLIVISLINESTFGDPALELTYNGDVYRIAASDTKETNELYNMGYGYYDQAKVWTKLNGKITGNYKYNGSETITVDHYTVVEDFPIFYGEWIIDKDNTTDLGIQYLSNILIESN